MRSMHVKRSIFCGLNLVLTTAACSAVDPASDGTAAAETEAPITAGALVTNNAAPFDSVVHLWCSGVKTGPRRFLTAAHCEGAVEVGAGFNGRIPISNALDASGAVSLRVARFYHHPSYVSPNDEVFDIAVIDVLDDTPWIPVLPIDSVPLADGALGVLNGYGCDEVDPTHTGRKQFSTRRALSLSDYLAVTSGTSVAFRTNVYNHYAIFNGGTTGPGLCPGDSGGPMFSIRDGVWRVAGINSFRNGGANGERLSMTTRTASVHSWLTASTPAIKEKPGFIINQLIDKCVGRGEATATLLSCDGRSGISDRQYWKMEAVSGSWWRLRNGGTNLCLEADRGNVVHRLCSSSALGQEWSIPVTNSWTEIRNRLGGVLGASSGWTLHTSPSEGTTRQRWQVRRT